jgi:hypothetical protein
MIYITGDTHGDTARFYPKSMPGMEHWTAEDTLLIAGDFGYLWEFPGQSFYQERLAALEHLASLPFQIAFCDGNHENYELLNRYPVEMWRGGMTHRIRSNIHHLLRGECFTMEGHTFFVMGGAASTDRATRIPGLSWWPEELPTNEEYHHASETLEAHGNRVDYILTHTAPQEIVRRMGYDPFYKDRELTGYLDWLLYTVQFRHWYFGHFHEDVTLDQRLTCLMWDVVALPPAEE